MACIEYSATDAVKKAELKRTFSTQIDSGRQRQNKQVSTNYKAKVDALMHAVNTISSNVDRDYHIVFLTYSLSVVQAKQSTDWLASQRHYLTSSSSELYSSPSHCGIHGYNETYRMAILDTKNTERRTESVFKK